MNFKEKSLSLRRTFKAYYEATVHEETTTYIFKKLLHKGDTFIDVGANMGYFTLLGATLVGPTGKVFSFEPEKKNFEYLEKNIILNGFNHVKAFNNAVSNTETMLDLYFCSYDSGHHTINQPDGIFAYAKNRKSDISVQKVNSITLDNFLNHIEKIDFIKIDVEGAEGLVLQGMSKILESHNLKMIIEFFPLLLLKMGTDPSDFTASLFKHFNYIYAIGSDYDMKKDVILQKINNPDEIIQLCSQNYDHINLLVSKNSIDL